jgi:prevent-host-death family protein
MQTITWSATKARNKFFDLLNYVASGRQVIIEKDKKEIALITPIKKGTDLVGLKKAMDALDGVAKDFDLSKSPLRGKASKKWFAKIARYKI